MSLRLKSAFLSVLLSILTLKSVSAVEVIKREEPVALSPMQNILDIVMQVWLPIVLIAIGIVVLMVVLNWMKKQREKDNVFLRNYNRTVLQCKMLANKKRIREKAIWMYVLTVATFLSVLFFVIALVTNDVPSFLLASYVFIGGFVVSIFLKVTKFMSTYDIIQIVGRFGNKIVGYYFGECITPDGTKNFLVWNTRKFLFWKNTFIIKVNLNDTVKVEEKDKDTGKRTVNTYVLPKDLLIEGENAIIIKGEGVDQAGYYYYPVLTDETGNIVNMDIFAYAKARDVAILDTLYQQTEDFSKVQREAINLNPNVRFISKTKGQSVSGGADGGMG